MPRFTKHSKKFNPHWVIGVLLLFALLYALVSIVNHLKLRTYALDLGVYTHALWQYAHGEWADCSIFTWPADNQNLLHDHFDLYIILFSPLVKLFGSYTLLIIQIISLLLGGWGIYRLIRTYDRKGWLPILAMICYLSFFGIWHAIAFDYHSNVVAVNLLPWLLLAIRNKRYIGGLVAVVMLCISKETTALWTLFILVALLFDYWKDRTSRQWIIGYAVFSLLYFVVISMVVMPQLGGSSRGFWRYSYLGESMGSMALYLITHPLQALRYFFTNFTGDADYNNLKLEFWLCCATSGMLLCLFKPNYLLMIIPPVLMKMMSCDAGFWGVGFHYNVEMAPVLVVGSFLVLCRWQQRGYHQGASMVAVLSLFATLATSIYATNHPLTNIRRDNVCLYSPNHYRQSQFDDQYAKQLMEMIPSDASVSAAAPFVPHLCLRSNITLFPIMASMSDYMLVFNDHWSYYDDTRVEFQKTIADTTHYEVLSTNGTLYLIHQR